MNLSWQSGVSGARALRNGTLPSWVTGEVMVYVHIMSWHVMYWCIISCLYLLFLVLVSLIFEKLWDSYYYFLFRLGLSALVFVASIIV